MNHLVDPTAATKKRLKITSYKNQLPAIFRWLRAKGASVKVLDQIDLNNIHRHSYQTPQFVHPNFLCHLKDGHLCGSDIKVMFELAKSVSDIDAFLYLVHDLIYNDRDKSFKFISPVKLYTNEERTESIWVFCIVTKFNNKVFLQINGLPDKEYPEPIFTGDLSVVGFSSLYCPQKIERNGSVIKF